MIFMDEFTLKMSISEFLKHCEDDYRLFKKYFMWFYILIECGFSEIEVISVTSVGITS